MKGKKNRLKEFKERFRGIDYNKERALSNEKIFPYPLEYKVPDKICRIMGSNLLFKDTSLEMNDLLTDEELNFALKYVQEKSLEKDGYNNGGYDWFVETFGSKWGICDSYLEGETSRSLNYSFSSAWSPVFPTIYRMSEEFPDLELVYYCNEESRAFRFRAWVKNGELIKQNDYI